MVTGVSSMPTDEGYDHDENSGSGNDDYVESQMTDCQCNDANLTMLNKKFPLMWLNFAEHHDMSKLSLVVHKLKVVTDHLEVSDSVAWQYMCT